MLELEKPRVNSEFILRLKNGGYVWPLVLHIQAGREVVGQVGGRVGRQAGRKVGWQAGRPIFQFGDFYVIIVNVDLAIYEHFKAGIH